MFSLQIQITYVKRKESYGTLLLLFSTRAIHLSMLKTLKVADLAQNWNARSEEQVEHNGSNARMII